MTYIDITEALTLSVPYLIKSVLFMVGVFFLYLFQISSPQQEKLIQRVEQDNTFSEKNLWGRLKTYYGPTQIMFGLVFPSVLLGFYFMALSKGKQDSGMMLFSAMYMFIVMNYRLLLEEALFAYYKNHSSGGDINGLLINILYYAFLIIIISCLYSVQNAYSAINSPEFDKCCIITEKNTLESTDNLRYLGKTKGYVFFYNKGRKAAEVYPMDGLRSLTIKEDSK